MNEPLTCPDCGAPVSLTDLTCRCGFSVDRRGPGIPSVSAANGATDPMGADVYSRILRASEDASVREAVASLAATDEAVQSVREELYTYGYECWRIPVESHLRGRCLDVYAGTGRRASLLAEQCDSVVALEPELDRLRLLERREDISTVGVHPVHGALDSPLLADGAFDTVVVDLHRLSTGGSPLGETLGIVDRLLATDGTALLLAPGALAAPLSTDAVGLLRLLRRVATGAAEGTGPIDGVEHAAMYGLYPTSGAPDYVFDATHGPSVAWFQTELLTPVTRIQRLGTLALSAAGRIGLLAYGLPGYLLVQSRSPPPAIDRDERMIVRRGRYRSTRFDVDRDGLQSVCNYPNVRPFERFNERERAVLRYVRETNDRVPPTLPIEDYRTTGFGLIRCEQPIAGEQLRDRVGESVDSFRWCLRTGLTWLSRLQGAYSDDPFEQTPAEVADWLAVDTLDVEFPPPPAPVRTFDTVVHGDFKLSNVFVDDAGVTTVIDWEYGELDGSPFVDPTNFLLTLALRRFGDLEPALDRAFLEDTPYARAVAAELDAYGRETGLAPMDVLAHLPAGLLHRIGIHDPYPTGVSAVSVPPLWVSRAETLAERLPDILAAFDRRSATP